MPTNTPVDVQQLRAEVDAARQHLDDLLALLALAERLYGNTSDPPVQPPTVPRAAISGPLTNRSTADALEHVLSLHAGEVVALEDVVDEMHQLGWDNGSPLPVDTVRVALSRRMKKDHRIERVRLGYYRYSGPTPAPIDSTAVMPSPTFAATNGANDQRNAWRGRS